VVEFNKQDPALNFARTVGEVSRGRVTFKKFAREIVWESEVWIAEFPDHMIHFNGDRFLGPYPTANR
jgi:type II restriction enzyme